MAGLYLYTSNRMEILGEQLAQNIQKPLSSPLAPEIIVVQSRGMERWISMKLAEFNGISANCSFTFPNALLEIIFKKVRPNLPEISPFDPAILTFRLMRIIPGCLNQKGFENLKSYLTGDNQPRKLFQLSGKIADLFDQYLVFRPELIFAWEEKKEIKQQPHVWQARLWRELIGEIGNRHRAYMRRKLFARIDRMNIDPADLPARIAIFGISYLPLFHLETFVALSKLMEVNFYFIDPCKEYWGDILSEREEKKMRQKNPQVAENIAWYHFEAGNRLLASLGTLGRNFFELITEFDCEINERFEEPETSSILARIQSDILNLRDIGRAEAQAYAGPMGEHPVDESGIERAPISDSDTSIQIHSCHSPMREIEVLHDNLMAMFEEDPELLPKDIIVMTPDIETYAPYVHAVFDAQTDETLRIPFSIADQSHRRKNRMIDGFLALLNVADSRFGALQVIRLMEYSGIKQRFGLEEADLKIIERWVKDTHIRWGIDKYSRLEAGLPDYPENTWQAGLQRLLLGYAMPGENRTMFKDILPYDYMEGGEVQILGRFLEFVDRLFAWAKILIKPRRLTNWQKILYALIDQFMQPDEASERDLQFLRSVLDELADKEFHADFKDKIEPEVIRSYLKSFLAQNSYGTGFLTGGVTFCAMLPMRSIPFKTICLIGMDNDAFPRDNQPLNFDLIANFPQTGDRSRRHDDKYLFLESIISARWKFYISYVGQSIQDNSSIPPSVLVSELLDFIENRFVSKAPNIIKQIVTHHRLQQFSPGYFTDGSGLFSYSTENMLAVGAAQHKRALQPFFTNNIPLTPEETERWQNLDLESLCMFFSNPSMFLIRQRQGIRLEDEAYLSEEQENFKLEPLERYRVEQDLVNCLLAGSSIQDVKPIQKAMGLLPHGNVGEYHYAEMSIDAQTFVGQIEKYTTARLREPLEFDFEIAGIRLSGSLTSLSDHGYVCIRYARRRVKDLLRTWIYHLVYCRVAPANYRKTSYLICKDSAVQFDPTIDSTPALETLVKLFRRGLVEPIRFFPKTSFEYAEQIMKKSAPEASALHRAEKKWLGSDYAEFAKGESRDPYYDLSFRHLEALDEEFKQTAVEIFEPLLAHATEIKI